jgi:predicted lipid-binding transport protein (Tim44 family)
MGSRLQIVFSPRPAASERGPGLRRDPLKRLKLFLVGLLFALLAIGVLIFVLVLGSIIAMFLWIALVAAIVIAGVILKVRRWRRRR